MATATKDFIAFIKFTQIFFSVIGVNLGVGILGLPISMAKSGPWPLIASVLILMCLCIISSKMCLEVVFSIHDRTKRRPLIPDIVLILMPKLWSFIVPFIVIVYFMTLLIGYSLAGGQAFAMLFDFNQSRAVPIYMVVFESLDLRPERENVCEKSYFR